MTNAVTYAESKLQVNVIFEQAEQALTDASVMSDTIQIQRSKMRDLESKISYREVEVTDEEWTKHPDMAVTRMDKHVKAAQLKDLTLQALHKELRDLRSYLESLEADKAEADARVRVYSARMIELGGYLQYLAVAKQAQLVGATPSTQE